MSCITEKGLLLFQRFNRGLKTLYVKVRWLYYNHFMYFLQYQHSLIHGGCVYECEVSVASGHCVQISMAYHFKTYKHY